MSEATNYQGIRPISVGVNIDDDKNWRSEEDQARVEAYYIYKDLYDGRHCTIEKGPYPHPYAGKLKQNDIPYVQFNMMAKCSRTFADLIASEPPDFTSEDKITESVLESIDFGLSLWEAVLQSSFYGFIGLKPSQQGKFRIKKIDRVEGFVSSWSWEIVKPEQLYIEYAPLTNEIKIIKNKIFCPDVETDIGKINILYEETHTKTSMEIRLYKIVDEKIIKTLPIDYYEFISPGSSIPAEVWEHNLGNFFITILANEQLDKEFYSDYSITAMKLQRVLNERLTQINRILGLHADPRLIIPFSGLKKNDDDGSYDFVYAGQEVLVYDDKVNNGSSEPYKLLTWNGELTQAVADRDNKILSILTEFDMSPQLLSFSQLISGTTADTAAKMEKMLHATIKRATRKQKNLEEALYLLCDNILTLQNYQTNYSINFQELLPKNIAEIIEEQINRKVAGLQSTKDAIKIIDKITDEEAQEKTVEIMNEQANSTPNLFRDTYSNYNTNDLEPLNPTEPRLGETNFG